MQRSACCRWKVLMLKIQTQRQTKWTWRWSAKKWHYLSKMNQRTKKMPIPPNVIDHLMQTLEVEFVSLTECLVSPGFSLRLGGVSAPGIHYNVKGHGRLLIDDVRAIDLVPGMLVVVPANKPFRIEVVSQGRPEGRLIGVDGRKQVVVKDGIRRFVAGNSEPEIILFCGYFHASYGGSTDLFASLDTPIVEHFGQADRMDKRLRDAMDELVAGEIGAGAMSAALLKQVIVALLRRSLSSVELWAK